MAGKIKDPAFKAAFPVPDALVKLKEAVANKQIVDFKTANEIRRAIGQKAADTALIADVSKGQWKNLYSAITKDVRSSIDDPSNLLGYKK